MWKQKDVDRLNKEVKPKQHKYRAKKVISNGVTYDSTREFNFKVALDKARIKYEMKYRFVLQKKFRYMGKGISEIAIIPDFIIYDKSGNTCAIVDVKGMITPQFRIKWKMLQNAIRLSGKEIPLFLPSTNTECDKVILQLIAIINQ